MVLEERVSLLPLYRRAIQLESRLKKLVYFHDYIYEHWHVTGPGYIMMHDAR